MQARLVPEQTGGTIIPINKPILLVGRHPDCDVVLLENRRISRRHCCLMIVGNAVMARDLGSMNGILVNDERVDEAELRPGDRITIGDESFVLEIGVAGQEPSTINGKPPVAQNAGASLPPTPPTGIPVARPPVVPRIPARSSSSPPILPVSLSPANNVVSAPPELSLEFPVAIPEDFDPMNPAGNISAIPPLPPVPKAGGSSIDSRNHVLDFGLDEDIPIKNLDDETR